ncbi:coiled-coil domain-containing protein 201 [Liasis olivaceus]
MTVFPDVEPHALFYHVNMSHRKGIGDIKMSEKNISLNFKRQPNMAIVKHSTPIEVSTCSKNMPFLVSTLNSLTYLPPLPDRLFELSPPFEENPDAQSLQDLLQRRHSGQYYASKEPRNSSQIVFPRRRLSTIIGSEESTEALHQRVPFPVTPRKRSSNHNEWSKKSWVATTKQASSGQEATDFKETVTKRKKKRNMDKKLVEKRVRQWELRQLKNIEEATAHELTIEDI